MRRIASSLVGAFAFCSCVLVTATQAFAQLEQPARWVKHFAIGRIEKAVTLANDNLLATIGDETCFRVWDMRDGRQLKAITHGHEKITAIAADPTGTYFAAGTNSSIIRIYRQSDWKLIRTLDTIGSGVTALCFSPDGQTLATGWSDFRVRTYDLLARRFLAESSVHTKAVTALSYSPSGDRLLSTGDTRVIARNATTLAVERTYLNIFGAQFTADGESTIMNLGNGFRRRVYSSGSFAYTLYPEQFRGYGFSPSLNRVVVLTRDAIDFYNASTGELEASYPYPVGNKTRILSFSNTNKVYLLRRPDGDSEQTIIAINAITGAVEGETRSQGSNSGLLLSPNEAYIAFGLYDSISVLDTNSGNILSRFAYARGLHFIGNTSTALIKPNATTLVDIVSGAILRTFSNDTYIGAVSNSGLDIIYRINATPFIGSLGPNTDSRWPSTNTDATYFANDQRILVGGPDLQLIDRATLKPIWKTALPSTGVFGTSISGDNTTAAVYAGFGDIYIVRLSDGAILNRFTKSMCGAALSPDGRTLAMCEWGRTYSHRTLQFYDVASGDKLLTLSGFGEIRSIKYTADGTRLLIGGEICGFIANPLRRLGDGPRH